MTVSFWLDQLEPASARPPLDRDLEADVCIVGGGFTGLWTAYELRRADPGLAVVVLEAEHVGCARDMTSSSGVRVPCGG